MSGMCQSLQGLYAKQTKRRKDSLASLLRQGCREIIKYLFQHHTSYLWGLALPLVSWLCWELKHMDAASWLHRHLHSPARGMRCGASALILHGSTLPLNQCYLLHHLPSLEATTGLGGKANAMCPGMCKESTMETQPTALFHRQDEPMMTFLVRST